VDVLLVDLHVGDQDLRGGGGEGVREGGRETYDESGVGMTLEENARG